MKFRKGIKIKNATEDEMMSFLANTRKHSPSCITHLSNWYGIDRKRVVRDPVTGKEYKVPADMTYPEWLDKYQNGGMLEETTDKREEEAKKLLMDEKALSVRKKKQQLHMDQMESAFFKSVAENQKCCFHDLRLNNWEKALFHIIILLELLFRRVI